jgi:hypothetical protein
MLAARQAYWSTHWWIIRWRLLATVSLAKTRPSLLVSDAPRFSGY